MMNHRRGPHHKIWTFVLNGQTARGAARVGSERHSDAGYTLVALLAVMTVVALFAMAAAPGIRQQAQRQREIETIFRGEEVADAIRIYYKYRVGQGQQYAPGLPTSMEQLLEGIPMPGGTKKRQILRASAAHDPLSASGEWRFVRPLSQGLIDFQRDVMIYVGKTPPIPQDPQIKQLQGFAVPTITNVLDTDSPQTAPSGVEDLSADSSGPFVGIASRSRSNSILYYYGIDRHDGWIFTPLFR